MKTPGFLKTASALLFFIAAFSAMGQKEMVYSQHNLMPGLYNPARAGDSEFLRVGAGARLQWVGIHNSPRDISICSDIPFAIGPTGRVGVGAVVTRESAGLFSNLNAALQGAWVFKTLKGRLSAGVRLACYNSRFKGSEIYIPDDDDYHNPDDPHLPKEDLSGNAFDISLGVAWTNGKWHAGVSLLHATSPEVNLRKEGSENSDPSQYQTSLPAAFYFEGSGNIKLSNTLFIMQPSVLLAMSAGSVSAIGSLGATYNRFLSAGLHYRWNDAAGLSVGAEFKNFLVGYSFDLPVSSLGKASGGSHEVVVAYRMKLSPGGNKKYRQRSIRIML